MIRRIPLLFLRYAAVHGDRFRATAFGPFRRRWARVELVKQRSAHLHVQGWADAEQVRFLWPGGSKCVRPHLPRIDVVAHRGGVSEVGFDVELPAEASPLRARITRRNGATVEKRLIDPDGRLRGIARARLMASFGYAVLRAAPAIFRYLLFRDQRSAARLAIKRALRLDLATKGGQLDAAWLNHRTTRHKTSQAITIVMPVFNAFELTKQALSNVVKNTDVPWNLIVIDDASTDLSVRPWLRQWANEQGARVTLSVQNENQGFVSSVNHGLRRALQSDKDGPVILLNSDAMVPEGWASRLIAPLADQAVASVTPMSNAAEIFSVPAMGRGLALHPGEATEIDRVAATLGQPPLPAAPTGVGFCMALSRRWLARVPQLDAAFGRGYGEEVDWCQKVRAMGGRHLCQPALFVEHLGGQSFGAEEKMARIHRANDLIARRYPQYDADVQRFIAEDPLLTPRLALAVSLAARRACPLPVFLGHSLGGGAEMALMTEVAATPAAVVLRVGGPARWQLEVYIDGQITVGQTDDLDIVRRLLAPAEQLSLVYSCGVGDADPISLPTDFGSLYRPWCWDVITVRIHDYFPLSPSYTLLDAEGVYRGVPGKNDGDPAHCARRPDGSVVSLGQWRGAWGALIAAAQEVTVFSDTSADLVREAFPDARIAVRPHRMPQAPSPVPTPFRGGVTGLLGNVNLQKGGHILRRMAQEDPARRIVVIGSVDPAIPMPRNVKIHGSYAPKDIAALARRYSISEWIMPAIWPETFSFSVHEALATGLPVAGFDLGAQGEALRKASTGTVIPLDPLNTAPRRLASALSSQTVANLQLAAAS